MKEICEVAGVNRSTFYLHCETIGDLLEESAEYVNKHFLDYMQKDNDAFVGKLQNCPMEELNRITPEYLRPYLNYIKEHQRLFCTVLQNAEVLQQEARYVDLAQHVLLPILERYKVPEKQRHYILAFYIWGIMAIVAEWLKDDCKDPIEEMIAVIQRCVTSYN